MSNLQGRTSRNWIELVGGKWPEMAPEEWKDVVRLIVLTTMVVEWADSASVTISQEERVSFRLTQEVPPGWFILASGYHDFENTSIAFNHFALSAVAPPVVLPAQTTCFVIGKLLVLCMSSKIGLGDIANEMQRRFKLRRIHPQVTVPQHPDVSVGYLHFDEVSSFVAKKHGNKVHTYRQKHWPAANWS